MSFDSNFVYSRKDLIVVGVALAIFVGVLGLGFGLASATPIQQGEETQAEKSHYEKIMERYRQNNGGTSMERALEILTTYPIIDGHNDFAYTVRQLFQNDLREVNFNSFLSLKEPFRSYDSDHTDLPRMRAGKVGGQFWSAYAGCDTQYKDATQIFMEQIDVIKRLVKEYPEDLQFATSSADVLDAMANGRIASMIGMESGHAIDSKLGALRMFYDLGVRYMTLTHSCNTPWADSSVSEETVAPNSNGLSAFGIEVVREMNRLGMMVDLSHVSASTMRDSLAVTRAPVIFSHSSSRAVSQNARNVPDDVLRAVARNGGIVMVNFYSCFVVDCETEEATIDDVVAHINHIRNISGVDHVGIGGDYNGVSSPATGLEDVSKYPNLFAALIEDGWSDEDLGKLASNNLLRVFYEVEKVRDALKHETEFQDWVPLQDLDYNVRCMSDLAERVEAAVKEA